MSVMVYVSCAEDKAIVGLELDDLGRLREVSRTAVPGTEEPSPSSLPLALSPDGGFLYAALRTAPFPIVSFATEADGGLRQAGMATLPDSMCSLATDEAGTMLFSASYGGACLGVSRIAAGIVGEVAQVVPTPPKAHCARPDPEGGFLYVACLGGDVILAQQIEGGRIGAEARVAGRTRAGAGPRHFVFAPGRLYCVNELDGTVGAYARDPASGGLTEIETVSALPQPAVGSAAAADIHLTPDGRFLYASVRATNTLAGFRVDAGTGRMALIGHWKSEAGPRGFAIDPLGRFLLCVGTQSGAVASYAIDAETGVLIRIGAVRAGAGANWIEFRRDRVGK